MIDKENNFDFLRLLFSLLVLVSHSFALSDTIDDDFFLRLTDGQIQLGSFSVKCFFIISGYLVYKSLKRSNNLSEYFRKRIVRIFPALIVVLLLTLLFIPLIYAGEGSIFSQSDYWSYFYRNLGLYHLQYNVGGIFETNPYIKSINGSLWTIRYEFTMYVALVLFLYLTRKMSQILLLSAFVLLFGLANFFPQFLAEIISKTFLDSKDLYDLGCYFVAGSLLASVDFENFKYRKWLAIPCLALLIVATEMGQFQIFAYLLLPLAVLGFGLLKTKYLKDIGHKIGDLSYGVYVYGFVVQQSLLHFFDLSAYPLMIYSILITMVFAFFSWHIVEKRALKLKTTT